MPIFQFCWVVGMMPNHFEISSDFHGAGSARSKIAVSPSASGRTASRGRSPGRSGPFLSRRFEKLRAKLQQVSFCQDFEEGAGGGRYALRPSMFCRQIVLSGGRVDEREGWVGEELYVSSIHCPLCMCGRVGGVGGCRAFVWVCVNAPNYEARYLFLAVPFFGGTFFVT